MDAAEALLRSRRERAPGGPPPTRKAAAEGGCGVLGVIGGERLAGRHLIRPMGRMRNRGNGKGGGVALVGLDPDQAGLPEEVLRSDHLLQVAYLDASVREELERRFVKEPYEVDAVRRLPSRGRDPDDPMEVEPPAVWRYFVRPSPAALRRFAGDQGLEGLDRRRLVDEYVYRQSQRLNRTFYDAGGEKHAFVLSHGVNMAVFKAVGYAEQVIRHYRLDRARARVWVAHQRYPTKGRVWHPAGAHPFCGVHEALVHNGDFANYASICQYLAQHGTRPHFLTDTEVGVLLFDLYSRVFDYPLEAVLEALAPTTERDFAQLPGATRRVYRRLQAAHVHGSPDGPWFFILARDAVPSGGPQLIGITDTSMLRPQLFALHGGRRSLGLIASERQAIDALLAEVAEDDRRVCPVADRYWVARGGSHTDGGAFVFGLGDGDGEVRCADKFGNALEVRDRAPPRPELVAARGSPDVADRVSAALASGGGRDLGEWALRELAGWEYGQLEGFLESVLRSAGDGRRGAAVRALTFLLDRRARGPDLRRNWTRHRLAAALRELLDDVPRLASSGAGAWRRATEGDRGRLRAPRSGEEVLVVDARGFPPEGPDSLASVLARARGSGWRRLRVYRCRGQRFVGCGLGPGSSGTRIDVHGAAGDYLGSGLHGAEVVLHGSGQDQLGQILKDGRLVVHGDVGQAFLYGAKGGEVYVRGSAAGRPLISAVGSVRAVINGTCLDYLAESFMAGDPHDGGGFVVLNGVEVGAGGRVEELDAPYPGGNLFSLASGGAAFVRDPGGTLEENQLNGGRFAGLEPRDWELIRPCLAENERLFGVSTDRLLTVDGRRAEPAEVYRKVVPAPVRELEPVAMEAG